MPDQNTYERKIGRLRLFITYTTNRHWNTLSNTHFINFHEDSLCTLLLTTN